MKVFMSPYDFPEGLNSQIQVTNFGAGLILTTPYVFPYNFGPSKATRMVKVPLESSYHFSSSQNSTSTV